MFFELIKKRNRFLYQGCTNGVECLALLQRGLVAPLSPAHRVDCWVFTGIFSYTPEPHVAFCPIFVHPLFPVFEPHIQKWVIFVRRRPYVCDTLRKKDRIWHRLPPPSRGLRQLNFPNVKNDVGQKKNIVHVF